VEFLYALALVIVGVLIFASFIERGPRATHGNFAWQMFPCTYVFFFYCLLTHFKIMNAKLRLDRKDLWLYLLFCAHAFTAIIYVPKMIVTRSYA